jgi:probable HAF family extracellular repeat protein
MMKMKFRVALGLVPALLVLPPAPARADFQYTLVDLGVGIHANAVNDSGQFTGYLATASGATHAFLSAPNGGALQDLGTLGGSTSSGYAINDSGQVAGSSTTANGATHVFLTAPNGGALMDLGSIGSATTVGLGVNASGEVAGTAQSTNSGSSPLAFLSGPGGGTPLRSLGTLGGSSSFGLAVNNSGQVAGTSFLAGSTTDHAFLSSANGGALKDLGTLGGATSVAAGVNASGQVAGYSALSGATHAFLSAPNGGALQDLGTLGGGVSIAAAVNDFGQVVGFSFAGVPGSNQDAFLYSNGQMMDLNNLIAPDSGFDISEATGISNTGYITAIGGPLSGGLEHGFLLIPNAVVPEPSSLVLVALGLAGVAVVRRRVAGRAAI